MRLRTRQNAVDNQFSLIPNVAGLSIQFETTNADFNPSNLSLGDDDRSDCGATILSGRWPSHRRVHECENVLVCQQPLGLVVCVCVAYPASRVRTSTTTVLFIRFALVDIWDSPRAVGSEWNTQRLLPRGAQITVFGRTSIPPSMTQQVSCNVTEQA